MDSATSQAEQRRRRERAMSSNEATQAFVLDILDKKYRIYDWCEQKISTLVTIDGLLLGALFLAVDTSAIQGWKMFTLFGLSIALLLGSILISLWHVVPLMYSGRSHPKNPRTSYGTEAYESNEEYGRAVMALRIEDMIRLDTDQIRGMNKNIMRDQRAIRWAARLTMLALIPTVALVVFAAL